ncbi:glycosyltransferase [Aerococcus tenax]|uniref:glycosyltransferase n=1 Tax=Aerococcus tenax TaxID=3078812 RepID=UPI0018A77E0B|nr:glycosyltransferase [Aerococcus tenax]
MKILNISTVEYGKNGITQVIKNLAFHMDHSKISYDFVFPNLPKNDKFFENKTVFILNNRMSNPVFYVLKLKKIMQEGNYDAVHIHGNSHTMVLELLAAKLAGIQVRITHAHNTITKYKALHFMLSNIFERLVTGRLACGEAAGKFLYDENKPYTVIENGIDLQKFSFNKQVREKIRSKLNIGEEEILIGHVGNFIDTKNQIWIIDNFNEIELALGLPKLVLVGDGPLRKEMEQKVKALGLEEKIIFTGNLDNVYDYFMAMDLFIMPSLYEGFPLVLVEAQASGLPCYVSDKVTNKVNITGLVNFFDLESKESLINQLQMFKKAPRQEQVSNNLLKNSDYNLVNSVSKLEHFYNQQYSQYVSE